MFIGTILGDKNPDQDDVIIVDDSQEVPARIANVNETTVDATKGTVLDVMYIPIVYGDCDNLNCFVL